MVDRMLESHQLAVLPVGGNLPSLEASLKKGDDQVGSENQAWSQEVGVRCSVNYAWGSRMLGWLLHSIAGHLPWARLHAGPC